MAFQFNPYVQTNAAGMFNIESDGYIVGAAMPDPSARNWLAGGWLAATETLPMFGGVAISEAIPQERPPVTRPDTALGGAIIRATVATIGFAPGSITGFSVFDQNYAAVNTPQSPCPSVQAGGLVNFYRLGSQARVALAIDPALISLEGAIITQQVSWDLANQRIIAFATNALPVKILGIKSSNCMVPVFNAGNGQVTWNYNGAAALCLL
jgi:hypothetical protein